MLAVIVGAMFVPTRSITWDGGWPEEEYKFTFRDRSGRPVRGVQLRVENATGTNFFYFPVADYKPDYTPTTDDAGILVFHHAPFTALSGHLRRQFDWSDFRWTWKEEQPPPEYVCRFVLEGQEIQRVRFGSLTNTGHEKVSRKWKWPTLAEVEALRFHGKEPMSNEGWLQFDLNGDGVLDREEMFMARAANDEYERALQISQKGQSSESELSFWLVERAVTVDGVLRNNEVPGK